ncbi:MAG: hypothetical protein RLZZ127_1005 [Planctomycetota bacterium]|jgi:hypothetical protein
MIRINLLPLELRKGRRSVNPHALGISATAAAAVLAACLWAWIHWVSLPGAIAAVDAHKATLEDRKRKAAQVEALEKEVATIKDQRDAVRNLIESKVTWAKTIDDLATLVSGTYTLNGFDVRISELAVTPVVAAAAARGAPANRDKSEKIEFAMKLRFKLLGAQLNLSGNYIKSFFDTVERSAWWGEHGFVGKPETDYKGDDPRWNDKIQRVVIDLPLKFTRQKVVGLQAAAKPNAAPATKAR